MAHKTKTFLSIAGSLIFLLGSAGIASAEPTQSAIDTTSGNLVFTIQPPAGSGGKTVVFSPSGNINAAGSISASGTVSAPTLTAGTGTPIDATEANNLASLSGTPNCTTGQALTKINGGYTCVNLKIPDFTQVFPATSTGSGSGTRTVYCPTNTARLGCTRNVSSGDAKSYGWDNLTTPIADSNGYGCQLSSGESID